MWKKEDGRSHNCYKNTEEKGDMFPYLFGMSSYDLMMNLGTAAGIAVLIWSFYRRVPSWKLTIQNFGLSLAAVLLGSRGANLVRMMNDLKGRSVAEQLIRAIEDPAGNHFLGRVLAAGILYLPIAAVWAKRAGKKGGTEEKKLWQAGTDSLCLFFVLQHLGNRLGCFGRGCCYGIAYQGPGAVFYSQGVPAQDGIAYSVFPSQLFEAVLMLVLLAGFLWLYWREKALLPWFCLGFGGSIWLSEFFMDHKGIWLLAGMDVIQYSALFLAAAGAWQFWRKRKKS